MKINTCSVIAALLWLAPQLAGAQTPEAAPPPEAQAPVRTHLDKCPKNVADFIDSDASATFVKKCLGRPASENRNPDGRLVYMYSFQGGKLMLAFLFASDGSMIRVRAYKQD